jgi:hypothetical protein
MWIVMTTQAKQLKKLYKTLTAAMVLSETVMPVLYHDLESKRDAVGRKLDAVIKEGWSTNSKSKENAS